MTAPPAHRVRWSTPTGTSHVAFSHPSDAASYFSGLASRPNLHHVRWAALEHRSAADWHATRLWPTARKSAP